MTADLEAEVDGLRWALAQIADLTERQQLPLTAEVYAIATEALYGSRDSDGTATAAANGDLPVPQDCQARAERHRPERRGHSSMTLTWPEGR